MEIVGGRFPVFHDDRIIPGLTFTHQSQDDMNGPEAIWHEPKPFDA